MSGFKSSYSSENLEQAIGAALLQEKYSYNITQDKKKNYSSLKEAIAAVTDEKYKVKGLVLTFFTGTEWVVKRYNGENASGFVTEGNWIDLVDKASTTKDGLMSKEDKAKLSNFVSGPTSVTSTHVVVFDGATGKLVKDSGFTIETSVPRNAKFTDTVYTHPTTPGNKHIPSGGSAGKILKWSANGTAVWGDEKDTTYSKATSAVLGLIKIGYEENGKKYPVELDSEGKAFINVPWTDTNTTYSVFKAATSSVAGGTGLVPAPAAGAQAKFLRADGTWQTPTNTTYSNMAGATSSAAGKAGLVPAPAAGKQASFLRGDGTWVVPTNTTYSKATTTTLGLVMTGYTENGKNYPVELDGSGKMFVNVPWTDNNTTYEIVGGYNTTGLVKNGSSLTSASEDNGYTACPIIDGIPFYKRKGYFNIINELGSYDINPDIYYVLKPQGGKLSVTLQGSISNAFNQWMFEFECEDSPITLSLPSSIEWDRGDVLSPKELNKYIVSIIGNIATYREVVWYKKVESIQVTNTSDLYYVRINGVNINKVDSFLYRIGYSINLFAWDTGRVSVRVAYKDGTSAYKSVANNRSDRIIIEKEISSVTITY